ncbi:hypothetical protein [Blastopirellula marina]|uniref:hypothetical protein n=1 Tax=Blastopirellula marina TaxID=124 RepID=UPI0011B0048D|nr:hypothetical protein [Blastopirellula marina]
MMTKSITKRSLIHGGLLLIVVGFVWGASAETAEAQYGYQRYRPSTPTLSPYVSLANGNYGPLPNYYAFVRPLENAQQTLQQESRTFSKQRKEILNQQNQLQRLQTDFGQMQISPTGQRAGWFRVDGPAGFRNTSHYYQRFSR